MTAQTTAKPKRKKSGLILNIILQIIAIAGIGLLVYPEAANWFAERNHNSEISGYVQSVTNTPTAQRQTILDAGYEYNDQLEPGPLTDPYISANPDEARRTAVYEAYEKLLRVSGSTAIGTVNYPSLGISLPIYHGTADKTISKGVGHLYGTSLPIGGPSTRAVLTSHSGLPNAKLFTGLLKAKKDDIFWVSVLGEDHYYQVQYTETVLPGDTQNLQIIENEDWVTLFTCTPIGVNSHRYMVHAIRIDAPEGADSDGMIAGDGIKAGFPWWAIWFIGGNLLIGWILFAPVKKKKKKKEKSGRYGKR